MAKHDLYESPLCGRYSSVEMQRVWSDDTKYGLWRRIWVAVAKAQYRWRVPNISREQIAEMEAHVDDINYDRVIEFERKLKHDVVSHNKAFGLVAPSAAPIIHLGCTSCDITDNAELIQIRDSLLIVRRRLSNLLTAINEFIKRYPNLATLGRTHLMTAQPTTVGKRAAMWATEIMMDLEEVRDLISWLPFRGLKDATGTQASLLELVKDRDSVLGMENHVAAKFGFKTILSITGQTYMRKIDTKVLSVLASMAASIHKIAFDIRELQELGEMEEPFEEGQVGSSRMPHKRNPMRSERACSLARELMGAVPSALNTQALQLFERTLDDSAGRRRYLTESFLLADSITRIMINVFQDLRVYPKVIERNLKAELPFLASALIMERMFQAGADRQEAHERLRQHAHAELLRQREGESIDLIGRIRADKYFAPIVDQLDDILDPQKFVGAAPQQAEEFARATEELLAQFPKDADSERVQLSV